MVDLHNHTLRCNHAKGSIDEYIKKAIEQNIKIFGFSDHAPMDFDLRYRMSFDEMKDYENDVKEAKKRYKDSIEITLGYEVDYLPGFMDERVLKADVDYLIGSVHFIDKWGFDNPEFIGRYEDNDIDKIWQDYFDLIRDMAKSKLFDIVGHLDLIKVFKFLPKKDIKLIATEAMDAIKESKMVIEINASGYRKPIGEAYPNKELLKMAYEREIPITFGSDAHDPKHIGLKKDEIYNLAKSVGYKKVAYFKKREMLMVNF